MSEPETTTVVVAKSRAFAKACLDVWSERSGSDHRWKLTMRAFDVPRDVIDAARIRLEEQSKATTR